MCTPTTITAPRVHHKNPARILHEDVLIKYGWSGIYGKIQLDGIRPQKFCEPVAEDPASPTSVVMQLEHWWVDVTVGFLDTRRFWAPHATFDEREGKRAASKAALDGLAPLLQFMNRLPTMEIIHAFSSVRVDLCDSRIPAISWDQFWKQRPRFVGIDVEGNNISPPVLVQIAFRGSDGVYRCILEAPHGSLSHNLKRLLSDRSIIKIFCDSGNHRDKKCLDIYPKDRHNWAQNYMTKTGDIIDIEAMANHVYGRAKSFRGLARILNLSLPIQELPGILSKPRPPKGEPKGRYKYIGRFILIEQGRAPPLYGGMQDLTPTERRYAALDAYCTLIAFERMSHALHSKNPQSVRNYGLQLQWPPYS